MRLRSAVAGMLLVTATLGAGAAPTLIRDWGLHREWRMVRDRAHPERPACLMEVPWTTDEGMRGTGEPRAARAIAPPPAVRSGARVTVIRREAMAEIRLQGTALGTAREGETIAVRAGLGNAVVRGIVRAPGIVEMVPEKRR